jgi:hypothetical protein
MTGKEDIKIHSDFEELLPENINVRTREAIDRCLKNSIRGVEVERYERNDRQSTSRTDTEGS